MNAVAAWFGRQAPDVAVTVRRFPLAVIFLALGTILVILMANDILAYDDETFGRLTAGLFGAVSYAVAGVLFAESDRGSIWLRLTMMAVVPALAALSVQIDSTVWIVSFMIPVVGIFWMSVAGFTRLGSGPDRGEQQDRFWWMNHRAITTGIVAAIGFAIVALGLFIIDQSLSFLFGLELGDIVYKFIFPIAGLFLTPLYWLSTLPRASEFERKEIDEPDFLSRAVGFLGQFVLTPLLLIYALILIAYGAQSVFLGQLPEGVLGWMVLVFIVTGAANWLVLHPSFMHSRMLVRVFRSAWFWLTLIPLGLYTVAVWTRIDAYGLTEERMLLISGGLWAGLLSLAFLTRLLPDIRLIPGLAGLLFLLLAIGPWNMFNAARWSQLSRLDAAMAEAQSGDGFEWSEESAAQARGAIRYLTGRPDGDTALASFLEGKGIEADWDDEVTDGVVFAALDMPDTITDEGREYFIYHEWSGGGEPALLTGTPLLYPVFQIYNSNETEAAGLKFQLEELTVKVWISADAETVVDLSNLLGGETVDDGEPISVPFELGPNTYRLVIQRATVMAQRTAESEELSLTFMEAMLAASDLPLEPDSPE